MLPSGEQPCSAPVRTNVFGHEKHEHAPRSSTDWREHPCSTSSSAGEGSASKLGSTEQSPSSGVAETSSRKNGTSSSLSLDERGLSPSEIKYRNLIENWVPPSFHGGCADLDDQDWLFERKQLNCDAGKCKADYDGLTYGSPSPWPRMHYLPEVDMYALPYTVPYWNSIGCKMSDRGSTSLKEWSPLRMLTVSCDRTCLISKAVLMVFRGRRFCARVSYDRKAWKRLQVEGGVFLIVMTHGTVFPPILTMIKKITHSF